MASQAGQSTSPRSCIVRATNETLLMLTHAAQLRCTLSRKTSPDGQLCLSLLRPILCRRKLAQRHLVYKGTGQQSVVYPSASLITRSPRTKTQTFLITSRGHQSTSQRPQLITSRYLGRPQMATLESGLPDRPSQTRLLSTQGKCPHAPSTTQSKRTDSFWDSFGKY